MVTLVPNTDSIINWLHSRRAPPNPGGGRSASRGRGAAQEAEAAAGHQVQRKRPRPWRALTAAAEAEPERTDRRETAVVTGPPVTKGTARDEPRLNFDAATSVSRNNGPAASV
jgi:hypothetical protein